MNWAPVTMRWPEQATLWMGQLTAAKDLASIEQAGTAKRLADLGGKTSTNPGLVGEAAQGAITAGRDALSTQMGEAPACLVVTPFQSGIGQGRGYQRFLSAPNLLQQLAGKLVDVSDTGRPDGPQFALCLMFLATRKATQQQSRDKQLDDLKALLANGNPDSSMRARLIGPGNATELRQALLQGEAPGHEWVLCAGALLVGSEQGLSFVRELVGL